MRRFFLFVAFMLKKRLKEISLNELIGAATLYARLLDLEPLRSWEEIVDAFKHRGLVQAERCCASWCGAEPNIITAVFRNAWKYMGDHTAQAPRASPLFIRALPLSVLRLRACLSVQKCRITGS